MEIDEQFLSNDFNVEHYVGKLLEENGSIPEQLTILGSNSVALDRHLKEQISAHYDQLLSQAGNIESLEEVLSILNQHIKGLKLSSSRTCDKVCELFKKTELRTMQLGRLHKTCSLLRNVIRILQLYGRLTNNNDGKAVNFGNDLAKNAQIIQELYDLSAQDTELKNLRLVQNELSRSKNFLQEILTCARQTLKQGAKQQHQAKVSSALQAFHNLRCLKQQMDGYGRELVNECSQILKFLDQSQQIVGKDDQNVRRDALSQPGSSTLNRHTQSSITIRTNLWNDLNRYVDFLQSICTQINVISLVASKKRDSTAHQLFDQLLSDCDIKEGKNFDRDSFYVKLFEKIVDQSKFSFDNANFLAKQTLESEYPRLLRYMEVVFAKLEGLKSTIPDGESKLRAIFELFETNYLSKSLARLFDSINIDDNNYNGIHSSSLSLDSKFQKRENVSSTPNLLGKSEIDSILRTINDEMDVCKFDRHLYEQARKNVAKTLKLFCVKCEQSLHIDEDARQIISSMTPVQKRNVEIANGLNYLYNGFQILWEQDSYLKQDIHLIESLSEMRSLMKSVVNMLTNAIQDALVSIIATMHQENFAIPQNVAQQCSLYVKEMQNFCNRVFRNYLNYYECKDLVREENAALARKVVDLFLIHTSLVRPINENGKLRMISDFVQVELALNPFFGYGSSESSSDMSFSSSFKHFKTAKSLFSAESLENVLDLGDAVESNDDRTIIPGVSISYSLLIHFIISISPPELPSPYVTAGWTLTKYVDQSMPLGENKMYCNDNADHDDVHWYASRSSELERLYFLKGTLENYARSVQDAGAISYASLYPRFYVYLRDLGCIGLGHTCNGASRSGPRAHLYFTATVTAAVTNQISA
uniref:Conserved oligomeric Golgi complex subunit 5 n=1 Tax=Romanomermis culicivorax TaxID=13658 RepID=A0A915IKT9_ROMCU